MISHRKYYFQLTVNLIEHDDYGYLDYNDEGNENKSKRQQNP